MTQALMEGAIYDALHGNAGVAALVGTRIFDTQADAELTKGDVDFITYQAMSGGEENDTPRQWDDAHFLVKYMSHSQDAARTGVAAMQAALQDASLSMAGWTSWRCECGAWLSDVNEMPAGQQWYVKGFYVHVSADSNT